MDIESYLNTLYSSTQTLLDIDAILRKDTNTWSFEQLMLDQEISSKFSAEAYSSEQKKTVLEKLNIIDEILSNINNNPDFSREKASIKICRYYVSKEYSFNQDIINYLNKIYNKCLRYNAHL